VSWHCARPLKGRSLRLLGWWAPGVADAAASAAAAEAAGEEEGPLLVFGLQGSAPARLQSPDAPHAR